LKEFLLKDQNQQIGGELNSISSTYKQPITLAQILQSGQLPMINSTYS
jgi:hypothetical protein